PPVKLLECASQLLASKVRTQTAVKPTRKGDVPVRRPPEIDLQWVLKGGTVKVGARPHHVDLVALIHRNAGKLEISGGVPMRTLHGRFDPHKLLDGGGDQLRLCDEQTTSIRV